MINGSECCVSRIVAESSFLECKMLMARNEMVLMPNNFLGSKNTRYRIGLKSTLRKQLGFK